MSDTKIEKPNLGQAFGRLVYRLRIATGWTQQELADKADIHRTYLNEIERDGRNVTLIIFTKLFVALGEDPSEALAVCLKAVGELEAKEEPAEA